MATAGNALIASTVLFRPHGYEAEKLYNNAALLKRGSWKFDSFPGLKNPKGRALSMARQENNCSPFGVPPKTEKTIMEEETEQNITRAVAQHLADHGKWPRITMGQVFHTWINQAGILHTSADGRNDWRETNTDLDWDICTEPEKPKPLTKAQAKMLIRAYLEDEILDDTGGAQKAVTYTNDIIDRIHVPDANKEHAKLHSILHKAVSVIYFNDNRDYLGALKSIVHDITGKWYGDGEWEKIYKTLTNDT